MPLVFVHGVNNRRGDALATQAVFDNRFEALRQQFRVSSMGDRVTAESGLEVFMPYWGDLGAKFARGLASLPQSGIQKLAVGDSEVTPLLEVTAGCLDAALLEEKSISEQPFITIARSRSLGAAIDLLFAATAAAPVHPMLLHGTALKIALEKTALFARRAEVYAGSNPKPAWLGEVADDEAFLDRLLQEIPGGEIPIETQRQTLGFGNDVKKLLQNGASSVRYPTSRIVQSLRSAVPLTATDVARRSFQWLSGFTRPTISAFMGRFMGDIFTYLDNRGPIIDLVLADIDKAVAAKRPGDDELLLVGHSFGGVILYDILSYFRPELACDLFVTVGSQVALFAELNQLAAKENIASSFATSMKSVVQRPSNIARWINIFDRTDIIGFGTQGVFAGTWDFEFETDTFPLLSHASYFASVRFHARLRARVAQSFANPSGTDQSFQQGL